MTSNHNRSLTHHLDDSLGNPAYCSDFSDLDSPMDIYQRDRFELLSAYLDGEVSPSERQQVQDWLEHDPAAQELHQRLTQLRYGLQTLPTPVSETSADALLAGVFAQEEQRQSRFRRVAWGGGAIAAVVVGALSFLAPQSPLAPRFAQTPDPEADGSSLLIAVSQPVVDIPLAPDAIKDLSISIDRPVVDIPTAQY
ncbi:MAG: Fis family transcriptional regulator [Spirulina sp. DLM2.Bin59]|nr:MAG: Fis family transcriptional regulator [Spirulina sp. DLM2.Bin59]